MPVFIKHGISSILKGQVPHSQCSLRENPKILPNLDQKITHLHEILDHGTPCLAFKSKKL
jgi:hypothetical protein